jgi:twitching motility protein PilJ
MSEHQSQSPSLPNSAPDTGNDCVSKILNANNLERSGQITEAIALYQEIIQIDKEGTYKAIAEKALANLSQSQSATVTKDSEDSGGSFWDKLTLRWKVTALAIAISTVPLAGIGSIAYYLASQSITKQITQAEEARAVGIADKLNRFMLERYGDIQVIAKQGILSNPVIRDATTPAEKESILNNYLASYPVYNSIAAFDLNGDLLVQSKGDKLGNHKNREYFQEVLKTGKPYISQPEISKSTGEVVIHVAGPIIEKATGKMIGVVRSRMPIEKVEDVIRNFSANGEEYHVVDSSGKFFIALEKEQVGRNLEADFPEISSVVATGKPGTAYSIDKIDNVQQVVFYAPFPTLEGLPNLEWDAVIGIDKAIVFAPQRQLLLALSLGTGLVTIAVAALAVYLANKGTRPILEASEAVEQIGKGDLETRLTIPGQDEMAKLGKNINLMAQKIKDLVEQQKTEAQKQRKEKERLQQEVVNLLLEIEDAQKGDLTVRAKITEGAIGSVADAFNATIRKLRDLVLQVQTVSSQVNELSQSGETSVQQFSSITLSQAEEINQALNNIAEINQSIQNVANFAQEAAQIARQGFLQAQEGDTAMDKTVSSIENIRTTVAGTAKKVKQLAESSQEIAQIVDIISGISEKTNLLAFNASVEAARAGENGQGFRIVADEVRRLADRVTEATKDIQQLVGTIQQDTASVLQAIEASTTEVVTGSELVQKTKQTLQTLATTSQKIDEYLQSISTSTTQQTSASQQINQKMAGVATIAQTTSTEVQEVAKSLRTLVEESETLQVSVSQFKLQA